VNMTLETNGLGKRYGRQWALRDCSLTLPTGRVAALVGPNGAGKTTLLHLAVGLLRPDAGSVRVLDEVPANNTALLARVGFVAQDTPLYRDFTAAELIIMGSKLNRRWDSPLARDRLGRLGIPLDRRVGKLSGGQRAQVALALALAKRPDLLLLDEPVASLDPLARREFLQALMGAVAQDGTTVLLSSHLVGDLERVCDYLIVLHAARVQVLGPVDALLAEHKLLVGPRRESGGITGVAAVIQASHTDKQSTLLVRTEEPIHDPVWTVHDITLEDLVLAYLADGSAGALPGPFRIDVSAASGRSGAESAVKWPGPEDTGVAK
jgi:ABC-type multidrug transport system ATPase subunit